MSDLRDLYQDLILDHGKTPRNFREMAQCTCKADGYNPLCGDRITVYLKVEGDVIKDISFKGSGCAISTASASMMTGALKGKTLKEATQQFTLFHDMLTGEKDDPLDEAELGKLAVFSGVCEFPVRVKCATLPWHTVLAALKEEADKVVSTE